MSFPSSLPVLSQFWKTVLGITVVVGWLREFFFWKPWGSGLGFAMQLLIQEMQKSESHHPPVCLTCFKANWNVCNTTLQTSTKPSSLVISWAASGWDRFIRIVILLLSGQREMNWLSALLCHTETSQCSPQGVQATIHCSLKLFC